MYGKKLLGRLPIQRLRNQVFIQRINGLNLGEFQEWDSLHFAERSVRYGRGPAYIVNAIVFYTGLDELPQVIDSMLNGLDDEYQKERIAILIGVNAPLKDKKTMKTKIQEQKRLINEYPFPVALVPITFGTKLFPYGWVRNVLLTSEESQLMTHYFLNKGFHPYISVQDFDTGSRRVGNEKGKHIFKAVDELLMLQRETTEEEEGKEMEEESDDENTVDELLMSQDEIMDEKEEETDEMDEEEEEMEDEGGDEDFFVKRKMKVSGRQIHGKKRRLIDPEEDMSESPTLSDNDFSQENKEASERRTHPSDGSDETQKPDQMGFLPLMIAGGYRVGDLRELEKRTRSRLTEEEAKKLSSDRLETFIHKIEEDMRYRQEYARLHPLLPYAPETNLFLDAAAVWKGSRYGRQLRFGLKGAEFTEMGKRVNLFAADEIEAIFSSKYEEEKMSEELLAELDVVSQNNRHPIRGVSVLADYEQLNTETDLSRLAAASIKRPRIPQSHAGLPVVADRFFSSKKDKKGVTLSKTRTAFVRKIKKDKLLTPSIVEDLTTMWKSYSINEGGTLSPALSVPYSSKGPFAGRSYGIAHEYKKLALRQIAIEQEQRKWIEGKIQDHVALVDNFRHNSFFLHGTQTRLQVSEWTKADGDCGIYALGILANRHTLTRNELADEISKRDVELSDIVRIPGRWLNNGELAAIGPILGLHDLAVVTFNLETHTWAILSGNPITSQHIIGAVPAAVGGTINHWVVLRQIGGTDDRIGN